jgi:two-component system NtrC family sensor kinase
MSDGQSYRISDETLRHLNRHAMVGQFVSGVAHELNNPLQVVAGLVELLQDRTDLPADVQTKLEKIGTHATRASQTIRNLLSFARDARTESSRVDVKRVIDHALSLRSYQQARMRITTNPDLPAEGVCIVMGSAQQVEQLVLNLVINAEQALARTPEGTERRIGIRLWKENGLVHLLVHDNGPAIDPAEREQVFTPFYSTLPPAEGIGLGVPVAAAIAVAHGGRLSLESAAVGTAFSAELPEAS